MTAHEVISSPPHPRGRRSAGPSGNRRPRRRLSSDAVCHIDRVSGGLRLTLRHDRPDGANVVVFSYAGELVRPAHVDVSGRVDLRVPTPHGRYDLVVVGPDGFRREHRGQVGRAVGAQVSAEPGPSPTRMRLLLHNRGAEDLNYTITPRDYAAQRDAVSVSVAPGMTRCVAWEVGPSHGWYDVGVSVAEDPSFASRLVGHLAPVPERPHAPSP